MRKIFLDVGAHNGQTLEEVTKIKYGFDLIMAFEPMPAQFVTAYQLFKERALVFNFGLSNKTGMKILYGDNINMGTSVFAEKNDINPAMQTQAMMYRASDLFRTFREDDEIIMKLNCEGAEIEILNDLITSGEIAALHNVMIDFDIRKVTGKEHLEKDLMDRMRQVGFTRYSLCDNVMIGDTHQDRIANWLKSVL